MYKCKPISTPLASKVIASKNSDRPFHDPSLFQSPVGVLQYLTLTRPDLSLAFILFVSVCMLLWYMSSRMLRFSLYLWDYSSWSLILSLSSLDLFAYVDVDWASRKLTCCSTSSYCTFLGANCISWSAKKQPIIARLTVEAEYRAVVITTAKLGFITFSVI